MVLGLDIAILQTFLGGCTEFPSLLSFEIFQHKIHLTDEN